MNEKRFRAGKIAHVRTKGSPRMPPGPKWGSGGRKDR